MLFDDEDKIDKDRRTSEFREIVGSIIGALHFQKYDQLNFSSIRLSLAPPLLTPGSDLLKSRSVSINLCSNWPQAAHDMPSLARGSTPGVLNGPLIFVCVHGCHGSS
jgi:hypothetical protein